jgi:hypothetical protein
MSTLDGTTVFHRAARRFPEGTLKAGKTQVGETDETTYVRPRKGKKQKMSRLDGLKATPIQAKAIKPS